MERKNKGVRKYTSDEGKTGKEKERKKKKKEGKEQEIGEESWEGGKKRK